MSKSPVVAFPNGVDPSVLQVKVAQLLLSDQPKEIQEKLIELIEMPPAVISQSDYMKMKADNKAYVFDDRAGEGKALDIYFFQLIHHPVEPTCYVHVKPLASGS